MERMPPASNQRGPDAGKHYPSRSGVELPYPLSNVLIQSLPEERARELMRQLRPVVMPVGTSLYEPNDTPKYAHFLTSGIASIVLTMSGGATSEVGTVGREGMPQGLHLLGPVPVTTRCFMQLAGTGLRMEFRAFERLYNNDESIRAVLLLYAQYQTMMLSQMTACNRLHDVEARLARWLLMIQDRTGDEVLKLTQEFLAQMIGSQRTTVSAVAGALQARGLIEYVRGRVRILSRTGLEDATCECYPVTHDLIARLYGSAGERLMDEAPDGPAEESC